MIVGARWRRTNKGDGWFDRETRKTGVTITERIYKVVRDKLTISTFIRQDRTA